MNLFRGRTVGAPLKVRLLALLVFVGFAPLSRGADIPIQDLLRRLPDSTNGLVVADVQGLRKALGVAPGTTLASADIGSLPIRASSFVMGAHLDLNERRHLWSIALCQLIGKMSMQDLAKAENESVDEVAGYAVVPSPRNGYFIELGPGLLAAGTPADRQRLKRWLSFQKNNQLAALSPYLLQAAKPSEPALMVMAVDLADSLNSTAIRRGVNRSQVMGSRRNPDYEGVAKTIGQVQGVTLVVRAGNPLNAELTVDFATDTAAIRGFAKDLLIETLQHAGVYVPDFDAWKPRLNDQSIGIYGPLSLNSLRKFGALISTPAPHPEAASMDTYQSMNPATRAATAAQRYYQKITQMLTDLRGENAKTWKGIANWYDQYSHQIDMLPILDVDPQLLAYGAATSEHLRSLSSLLKGIQSERGQLHYNSFYGYQGSYVQGTGGGVTQAQAQYALGAEATAARTQLWERIDNETAEMRRQMTQKYQIEF